MTMQEFDDGMTYDSNGFAGDDGLNGNEQTDDAMGGGESPEIKVRHFVLFHCFFCL